VAEPPQSDVAVTVQVVSVVVVGAVYAPVSVMLPQSAEYDTDISGSDVPPASTGVAVIVVEPSESNVVEDGEMFR